MKRSLSIQNRLGLAYTVALIVGCALFATVSLVVSRATTSDEIDARLHVAAYSAAAIVDVTKTGRLALDDLDREQIRVIAARKLSVRIMSTTASIFAIDNEPAAVAAFARSATHEQLQTMRIGGNEVHVAVSPIERRGRMLGTATVWQSLEEYDEFARRLALIFVALTILIASVAFVIGREVARRGLAPLRRIADLASEIEGHDLTKRLNASANDDELGRLSATFDRMLDRLQASFERQRRFTADASHELRAPLSVVRAEADLALRRIRSTVEYRDALQTIADEADRLDTLIDALLSVARADAGDVADAPFDLGAIARDAALRMAPLARTKDLELDLGDDTHATIVGNEVLVSRALVAIVHNAVKYAPERGRVDLRVRRIAADVVVDIGDNGPGFTPDGLRSALDRFWRDDLARGRSGAGLGLAIAKAVVERSGGTLTIGNRNEGGACVSARFPISDCMNENRFL
jgi:two-component system OmpR family sensor kinase